MRERVSERERERGGGGGWEERQTERARGRDKVNIFLRKFKHYYTPRQATCKMAEEIKCPHSLLLETWRVLVETENTILSLILRDKRS